MNMLQFQTDSVFIYPIKSIGAVKLNKIDLTESGLKYDRHWMIVYPDGKMISQREFPQLNKVHCIEEINSFRLHIIDSNYPEISFPKTDILYETMQVNLWGIEFTANKTQKLLADWLSDYLNERIYIVTKPNRLKELRNFNELRSLNFQDGSPVHLVNLCSVKDLSNRCKEYIAPMRFRANIYLDLKTAYVEDELEEISINGIEFKFIKPCERCMMINLKPEDDVFQKEPLKTLSEYRKIGNQVHFGAYIAPVT